MITVTKPTYKCEHCKKLYQSAKWCEKHEIACNKNPANYRKCLNCVHCELVEIPIYEDMYGGGHSERMVNAFTCNKKEIYLVPPSSVHKGNAYEMDEENVPMPLECEEYKDQSEDMEAFFNKFN